LGLTAGDLLFFNVKQNTFNKTAIENRQNKPMQKWLTTYQYKPCLRSTGKVEKIAIVEQLPLELMSAGTAPYRLLKETVQRNAPRYSLKCKFFRAVYYAN
jgi:hypothetical protein